MLNIECYYAIIDGLWWSVLGCLLSLCIVHGIPIVLNSCELSHSTAKLSPQIVTSDPQIVTLYLISLIVDSCHDNIYYLLFTVPHTMHLTLRLTLCYKTSASLLGALTACRVHQLAALLALSPSTRLATQCCFHRHQLRS